MAQTYLGNIKGPMGDPGVFYGPIEDAPEGINMVIDPNGDVYPGPLNFTIITLSKTLTSEGWSDQEQNIMDSTIKETSPGDVKIAISATDEQAEAWAKASPRVVAQSNGSITLRAAGVVPTINIPIIIEIRG